jgi:hypothetical protein
MNKINPQGRLLILSISFLVFGLTSCNKNLSRTPRSTAVKPAVCQNLATPVVASTTCAATFKSIETQIGGRTNLEVEEPITKDIILETHLDVGEAITKDIVAAPQPFALFGSLGEISVMEEELPGLTVDREDEREEEIPSPSSADVELTDVISKDAADELRRSLNILEEEPEPPPSKEVRAGNRKSRRAAQNARREAERLEQERLAEEERLAIEAQERDAAARIPHPAVALIVEAFYKYPNTDTTNRLNLFIYCHLTAEELKLLRDGYNIPNCYHTLLEFLVVLKTLEIVPTAHTYEFMRLLIDEDCQNQMKYHAQCL